MQELQEAQVWHLGWEDTLEKKMTTHSGILAWKFPWREKSGMLQSIGLERVRPDWTHAWFILTDRDLLHFSYHTSFVVVVFVQSLNHVWLCNPLDCSSQAPLSFTISQSLFRLMSIELMVLFNHFILCCPLLLLPSIFPSIRVFSSKSALHNRWPLIIGASASASILPINLQSLFL